MVSLRGLVPPARVAMLVLLVALSGCAPALLERSAGEVRMAPLRETFDLSGRLSAHRGGDALTGSFRWHHDHGHDELEIASPLGQLLARLSGAPARVQLETDDGRVETAADWAALTERGLGWPLPIDGLASWIQGVPREGIPFVVEPDAAGDPGVLQQDGWTIVYRGFAVANDGTRRPMRITLSYLDVELRFAIDGWH